MSGDRVKLIWNRNDVLPVRVPTGINQEECKGKRRPSVAKRFYSHSTKDVLWKRGNVIGVRF
jgi:hypothetical protein